MVVAAVAVMPSFSAAVVLLEVAAAWANSVGWNWHPPKAVSAVGGAQRLLVVVEEEDHTALQRGVDDDDEHDHTHSADGHSYTRKELPLSCWASCFSRKNGSDFDCWRPHQKQELQWLVVAYSQMLQEGHSRSWKTCYNRSHQKDSITTANYDIKKLLDGE